MKRFTIWMLTGATAMILPATQLPAGSPSPVLRLPNMASLDIVARVDQRFQSYNVEMAEIIGARFWAPYNKDGTTPADRYRERTPLDLRGNKRFRVMTGALGPAYMRVSGTWANSTFFQDDDRAPLTTPPTGYRGVLTRAQWADVVDFAHAVDAKIVTSFPISEGARNPDGTWNSDNARRFLRYNKTVGGPIVAIQPINEPNLGERSGLPKSYNAEAFARDSAAFRSLIEIEAPEVKVAGPTATGDAGNYLTKSRPAPVTHRTMDLMSASPSPRYDIFAYHQYTSASQRCVPQAFAAKPDVALSEEWLGVIDKAQALYATMRDRFAPGAPIWVTEIAQAACGGDPWAATFIDTFRYTDTLGRLAKEGVEAVFHNTLAASDYALIDEESWEPRPSYWAALLWRRLMGETVLNAGPLHPGLHLYAHCLPGTSGGVSIVAINLDRTNASTIRLPLSANRYTLTADDLLGTSVKLNGHKLEMQGDILPPLPGQKVRKGNAQLPAASINFFSFPGAMNTFCRATSS